MNIILDDKALYARVYSRFVLLFLARQEKLTIILFIFIFRAAGP